MSSSEILVERDGPVTTVTINRPHARNACTVAMVKALHDAFAAFEADPTARVAVLTGAGGSFCAGADLKEMASGSALGFCWAGEDKGVTRRMLSKPVIAAVSGHAVAAGLALAVRLPRLIGQSRALDMMLTGRAVDANEAYAIGLANRLVPAGQARVAAERLAHELASLPQTAMLSDRASLVGQWDWPEDEAIRREIAGSAPAFAEGFQSGAGRFVTGDGRHGKGVASG